MTDVIELSIKPEWDNIEIVRDKTLEFLQSKGFCDETNDAIIMIISELTENAIKYGRFSSKISELFASVTLNQRNITVEVRSPVDDDDDVHFARLDSIIQRIRGYQNPFEAYIEKIKEIALMPVNDTRSGLGIVRIAYEGQAILDFYVNDDNIISISAVYHLARKRRS